MKDIKWERQNVRHGKSKTYNGRDIKWKRQNARHKMEVM